MVEAIWFWRCERVVERLRRVVASLIAEVVVVFRVMAVVA